MTRNYSFEFKIKTLFAFNSTHTINLEISVTQNGLKDPRAIPNFATLPFQLLQFSMLYFFLLWMALKFGVHGKGPFGSAFATPMFQRNHKDSVDSRLKASALLYTVLSGLRSWCLFSLFHEYKFNSYSVTMITE